MIAEEEEEEEEEKQLGFTWMGLRPSRLGFGLDLVGWLVGLYIYILILG